MTIPTTVAMADKRRKHLEEELVRVAQELAQHTGSPSYVVPYTHKDAKGNGVMRYVAVGTVNSLHAMISRLINSARIKKAMRKKE